MVAVKALKDGCGPQLRSGWQREIEILRTLYHEHIVKYKGCCEDQGKVCAVAHREDKVCTVAHLGVNS